MSSKLLKILLLLPVFHSIVSYGQEQIYTPISSKIFSPFIYNPAIAGSKDYSTIDLTAIMQGSFKSETLNASTRIMKRVPGYYYYKDAKDFSNFGLGGYIFNETNGIYHNAGISGTLAYHMALSSSNLSFLSIGASIKGVYSFNRHSFHPNIDVGAFYYGISFFAGFSANNFLGNKVSADSLGIYNPPVLKQYLLTAGYKIYISHQSNIVLEPSVIIYINDSTFSKLTNSIHPMLKIYANNLCFGTYLHDYNQISLFMQYKFTGFYVGAFFEIPRKSPYYMYKSQQILELSIGLNISNLKQRLLMPERW